MFRHHHPHHHSDALAVLECLSCIVLACSSLSSSHMFDCFKDCCDAICCPVKRVNGKCSINDGDLEQDYFESFAESFDENSEDDYSILLDHATQENGFSAASSKLFSNSSSFKYARSNNLPSLVVKESSSNEHTSEEQIKQLRSSR
jgi:hypothetical protein